MLFSFLSVMKTKNEILMRLPVGPKTVKITLQSLKLCLLVFDGLNSNQYFGITFISFLPFFSMLFNIKKIALRYWQTKYLQQKTCTELSGLHQFFSCYFDDCVKVAVKVGAPKPPSAAPRRSRVSGTFDSVKNTGNRPASNPVAKVCP